MADEMAAERPEKKNGCHQSDLHAEYQFGNVILAQLTQFIYHIRNGNAIDKPAEMECKTVAAMSHLLASDKSA